jgi:hypothetical protein
MADASSQVSKTDKGHEHEVVIVVNRHDVLMKGLKATGLQIKQAAIAQGVSIKIDFVLFEVRP